MDEQFTGYESAERESQTEREWDEADLLNEGEILGENERTKEELWHDIYQAVRNARRYLITESEIQRAVTEALHD
jgi:hypothetical protein